MKVYAESDCCYCTLFNTFYLERGITMLRSLIDHSGEIRIYVLAMDGVTFDILRKISLPKVAVIRHEDFVSEKLLAVQEQRTTAEYCWTCTASLIRYILEVYQEKICTYLDADLFFYKNPYELVNEMLDAGSSVQIVEHRFGKGIFAEHMRKYSGTFCVQFNTFENSKESRRILNDWAEQCIECCSSVQNGKTLGDQKYLEEWPQKYSCVHVLQNEGGGVAPWNIHQYRLHNMKNGMVRIKNKSSKKVTDLVFYHYHGLQFLEQGRIELNVFSQNFGIEKRLVELLYRPYIEKVLEEKKYLKEYFGSLLNYEKQSVLVGKTRKAKREIKWGDLGEKLYCRLRGLVLKTQKKKDYWNYSMER